MDKPKLTMLLSVIAGIIIAVLIFYAYQYSSPMSSDSLRITVEQTQSSMQEGLFLLEQAYPGRMTNHFFQQQARQLSEHVDQNVSYLRQSHPNSGIENQFNTALEQCNRAADLLHGLSSLSIENQPDKAELMSNLVTTREGLNKLAESL